MKKASLIKLLLAIGVSQANAEKIAILTPDEGTELIDATASETLISDWKTAQIDLAKNNPDIVNPIKESERAKQLDIVERKIKQTFGLNSEDLKDKKIEEIITLAKTKVSSTGNKDVEELQKTNMELEAKLKKIEEEEIPKIRKEVDSHKEEFNYEQTLTKKVSSFELRNPLGAVLPSVKTFLKENYDIKKDDKGNYVVFQKGSDLRAKTSDGNSFLELDSLLKEQLNKDGFLKQSNADDKDKDKIIVEKGKEGSENRNMLHLEKAKAHAAKLAEEAKKQ